MDVRPILRTKRDGGELSEGQIRDFMAAYTAGDVPDYQASALLMAIFVHGMAGAELVAWTRAMLESGVRLAFDGVDLPKADKHSTGGVGDKVSIPLAPAVAACGVAVPMISGRGLGHTGGTLDKLEAIPGFRTDLSTTEFRAELERTGVALGGQTAELVPADRKLYALRDVTGLVESLPLIASSILSKKLAEGIDALVLDVKFGSGAFLVDVDRGEELARTMIELAAGFGLRASALHTAMDRPLGRTMGNALEIAESLECLRGGGPADLRALVCACGGAMLADAGVVADAAEGERRVARALDDGSGLERFRAVVAGQGGDPRVVDDPGLLDAAPDREVFAAPADGHLAYADVRALGWAVVALGGGREQLQDAIDPAVGLVALRAAGEEVRRGEPLFEIHHRAGRGLERARELLAGAVRVGPPFEPAPLVRARFGA